MGGEGGSNQALPPAPTTDAAVGFWARVQEHKIIQWGVGYLGAALALAHGAELVGHALHWPDAAWRTVVLALIVGFPIAVTLAWYHGHRGLKQVGAGELMMISVLVLIGAVFFTAVLRPSAEHVADSAAPEPAAIMIPAAGAGSSENAPVVQRAVLPNSVAVLPFENLSPAAKDGYFAAGIHEEVLSQLAKLRNLTVISRTSVARYANTDLSIPQIAEELRVGAVMEGSVRYSNDRVRIQATLIDPTNDQPLWSDTYERDFADVFVIQADIAMNIANALETEFSSSEQQTLERKPTSSPAAYALYLEARAILRSAVANDSAHALLDRAISIDPEFGLAYGLKAIIYSVSFVNSAGGQGVAPEDRTALERLVREYSQRALAIDPTDPSARDSAASLNILTWNWSAALQTIDQDTSARVGLVPLWIHSWIGEYLKAVQIGERGVELNPNDATAYLSLGVAQAYAGDRSASTRSLERALELAPALPIARAWLAYTAVALGNAEGAAAELQLVERLLGDNRLTAFLPELAYAYSRIGRIEDARRLFDELQELA
jgi:TolB-like protein